MPIRPTDIFASDSVRSELRRAWKESHPGLRGGSEEGGFIVQDASQIFLVVRWPKGAQCSIRVPPHLGGKVDGLEIIASFHTHPNTGPEYQQEPSENDLRGVREDLDLKRACYVGEFVISDELIYLITPVGSVREIGERIEMIGN